MGSKTSTLKKTENNTYIVNQTDVDILQEKITEKSQKIITKVLNKNAVTVNLTNKIDLIGSKLTGSSFTIGQKNVAVVDFSVEVINEITQQLQSTIANEAANMITSSADSSVLTDLVNNAKTQIEKGFVNTDFGGKDESVDEAINNLYTTTSTNIAIKEIVKIAVNSEINTDTVNECVSTLKSDNIVEVIGTEIAVTGEIVLTQENALTLTISCLTDNEIMNAITDNIANITKVEIINDTTNNITSETESTTDTDVTDDGLGQTFEDLGSGLGTAIDAGSGLVSSATSGMAVIVIGVVIVIGMVLIVAVVFIKKILTDEHSAQNINAIGTAVRTATRPI